MRMTFRSIARPALALSAALIAGCGNSGGGSSGGSGATASSAASTVDTAVAAANGSVTAAAEIVQRTANAVTQIPQMVYDAANGILNGQSNTDWGKPKYVVVTDANYVLLYETSAAEQKRLGHPRMVVIKRDATNDPTRY